MQLASLFAVSALAIPSVLAVAQLKKSTTDANAPTNELIKCVEYYNENPQGTHDFPWGGYPCAKTGKNFYIGHSGHWESRTDCAKSCFAIVNKAIQQRASSAMCEDDLGDAACWFGFE